MAKLVRPNVYDWCDAFRDGFSVGIMFQQIADGVIDITENVQPAAVDFVRNMAADNDYEFMAFEGVDGMTAVHLHRVG